MKSFVIFLAGIVLMSSAAQARSIVFKLDCVQSTGEVTGSEPKYQIVKTSSKDSGKWVNTFSLVESAVNSSAPVAFKLEEASGDEGYLVYRAQGVDLEKFGWIKIGNKFQWASFATDAGDFDCSQAQ